MDSAGLSEFRWLAEKLKSNTRMKLAEIRNCVQLLVEDGIDDETILAALHPDEFTSEYLKSIGIISLGARQHLMRIHQNLVEQHGTHVSPAKSTHLPIKKVLLQNHVCL